MPDLFHGFKWREVAAIVLVIVFFVVIVIDSIRDLDAVTRTRDEDLRKRIRALEVGHVRLWCQINPETCLGQRQ